MPQNIGGLILAAGIMFAVLAGITVLSNFNSLNIKAKTVGHGQHGTARWATNREIIRTYTHVNFTPALWREGKNLPSEQGIVVGCKGGKHGTTALVDTGDVHAIMIGAAGVGKTAYWLYCSNCTTYDYDPYEPDWDDEGPDETVFMEILVPVDMEETPELDPSEVTWRVQISYSNGEHQDIRCGEDYLPNRVEELRWRMLEYFEDD